MSRGLGELGEVVGDADQRPFRTHVLDAVQQELARAACLFDLPEHRFYNLLSEAVAAASAGSFQLSSHGLGQGSADLACGIGRMLGATRGDLAGDAARTECVQIGFAQIAAIGEGFFRTPAEVRCDPVDERNLLPWSRPLGVSPCATMIWAVRALSMEPWHQTVRASARRPMAPWVGAATMIGVRVRRLIRARPNIPGLACWVTRTGANATYNLRLLVSPACIGEH